MTTATLSLRIPRGLWADLEETVIQQDRLFLTEVARSLGLPVQEVLRKCLGTGTVVPVPCLWTCPSSLALTTDAANCCPWWECRGSLWRRCPRMRLSSTLPCQIHERCTPCARSRLDSDPELRALETRRPVRRARELYWVTQDGKGPTLREDGTVETNGSIRFITHRGAQIAVWVPAHNTPELLE